MYRAVIPDLYKYLEDLVNQIPPGKVTTFKTLAHALGSKYATRFIAQTVKYLKAPWWRVVNEKGEIRNLEQLIKLRQEGIEISNGRVNLQKHLFTNFVVKERPLEVLRNLQKKLSEKVIISDTFTELNTIGGVDLSYKKDLAVVVYVILDIDLNLLKTYVFREKVSFPYIPTFLSFREGEPILKTFDKIQKPDLLFVNGQGIAHPVRLGLASYVGVLLDIPTIGVTRKHLYGKIKGNKIYDDSNRLIGFVLEKNGRKIFVSPGHKVSVSTAKKLSEKFWIKGGMSLL